MATKIFNKPIIPMIGADASTDGVSGLVPTPESGKISSWRRHMANSYIGNGNGCAVIWA